MTEKRVKAWVVVAFYLAAAIGFIDMAAQASSQGCTRPIQTALRFITGMESATKPPAHCVVPVTIIVDDKK